MAGLHQLLLVNCIIFSVATLTTAVPFDRQLGFSSTASAKKNVSSDGDNVCTIDDVLYQVGDAIPTASPCEKCVCRPPGFACSIITCEKRPNCRALQRSNQCCPEYKCDCEHEGKVYHNGEKLDNTQNPCKVCYCQGGEVVCTVIECYKRDDCVPKHVPGMCCPKYDNCPPRDPARSVQPANTTAAPEAPELREVADERLNLLGEPEVTNQPPPQKPISNNIYDLPQGDDPQVYEAYDDTSTSTSTTGFDLYEELSTASTSNGVLYYDEATSSTSSSTGPSTSTTTTGGSSTPWTSFPTFPSEWQTLGPEWNDSTSISSNTPDGDTEYIPTWGTYNTSTSTSTQSTATSPTTSTTWSTPTEFSSSSTTETTDSSSMTSTTSTESTTYSTLSTSTSSSTSPTFDTSTISSTISSSSSTFSTQTPFPYHLTGNVSTASPTFATSSTDDSTVTTSLSDKTSAHTEALVCSTTSTIGTSDEFSGSGDGEPESRNSNCIDGNEENLSLEVNSVTPSEPEQNTDSSVDSTTTTRDDSTSTSEQESRTASDSGEFTEASSPDVTASYETSTENKDLTASESSTETGDHGVIDKDVQADQQREEDVETNIWSNTRILPDVLDLKSNKTIENARVALNDSKNDTVEANGELAIPQEWLKKSEEITTDNREESRTSTDDGTSTVTTESSTQSSTEAGETSATTSSTGYTSTETTENDSTTSTLTPDTETPTSSTSETFSTTLTSETSTQSTETSSQSTETSSQSTETSSQSTETAADSTTTEISS